MRATLLALLAVATLVFPAALAGHCEEPNLARESDLEVRDASDKVRYYVEIDECDKPTCQDVWVYEETNGYGNLQRRDSGAQGVHDDTCHAMIRPDTRVL